MNLAGIEKKGSPDYMFQYNQGTGDKQFKVERNKSFGLNWDETRYRTYDYQLGRFNQVDPKSELYQEHLSPYQYAWNNPIRYNDPEGDIPPWLAGAAIGAGLDYALQVVENAVDDIQSGEGISTSTFTDVDGKSILISGVAGATGAGLAAKINKIYKAGSKAAKAASMLTDGASNAAQQYAKTGEVNTKDVLISVVAGQTIRNPVNSKIKNNSTTTQKTKVLTKDIKRQESKLAKKPNNVNRQNAADKAKQKLSTHEKVTNYKAALSGSAASGGVTKAGNEAYELLNDEE